MFSRSRVVVTGVKVTVLNVFAATPQAVAPGGVAQALPVQYWTWHEAGRSMPWLSSNQ